MPSKLRKKDSPVPNQLRFKLTNRRRYDSLHILHIIKRAYPKRFGKPKRGKKDLKNFSLEKFRENLIRHSTKKEIKLVVGNLVEREGLLIGRTRELNSQRTTKANRDLKVIGEKIAKIRDLKMFFTSVLKEMK